METSFVERLAAARIGETFNQYADSVLRRDRLAAYLAERSGRGSSSSPRRPAIAGRASRAFL